MKRIKTFSTLVTIIISMGPVLGQVVPAKLDSLLSLTLDSMRNVLGAKSLSAAMQLPDDAVWAFASGISSENPLVNVTVNDAYLIGSVTKTLTSACILQLHDEGVLSIDDSLYQWLDTFPYINPNITLRQLLRHTSGIHDVLATPGQQDSLLLDIGKIWTPEELIQKFIRPPLFQPGASWSYSNTNYFLLGMIIEKATGNPFYVELRKRFFEPLGLGSFAIPAFEPMNQPVAHVWMNLDNDNILDDGHAFYQAYLALNSTAGAAGGYYSTPTDCTKWMKKYMRGDLLTAETMAQAKTTVNAPGSQGGKYGLGLMKNSFLGELAYGHGGDLAYHASSWYFPEKDISITVFTNDSNKDSWKLLPVVAALLRTCMQYEEVSPTFSIESDKWLKINAFPNPFTNKLSIEIQGQLLKVSPLELQLCDEQGRVMATQTAQSEVTIIQNLAPLSSGIYYLTALKDGVPMRSVTVYK